MVDKLTVDECRKLLGFINKGYEVPDIIMDIVGKVAQKEIVDKDKVVIIKRDPNIGRDRIQAMRVRLIDRETIEIYPSAVAGFGADFDGDQVAVFVPISEEAQQQALKKMLSVSSNQHMNSTNFELSKEMLVGLYVLTKAEPSVSSKTINDVSELSRYSIDTTVTLKYKGKLIRSTVGRFIFNEALPDSYPFVDEAVTKEVVNPILANIIEKSESAFAQTIDSLLRMGFYYSTVKPQTITLDMLTNLSPDIKKLKLALEKETDINKQSAIIDQMNTAMEIHLKNKLPDLYNYINSGSSKGSDQLRQVMISKGTVQDPSGNPFVVKPAIAGGFTAREYFDASASSRDGLISKALGTAEGGYMFRKAIFVIGNVRADINNPDCYTKRTLDIKLTKDVYKRLSGRFVVENRKVIPISEKMIGSVVHLRSPIFCRTKNICRTCYGKLLSQVSSTNVGLVSAQEVCSLAESFMKKFHTGGAVRLVAPDIVKDVMANVPDNLFPKVNTRVGQDNFDLLARSDHIQIIIDRSIFKDKYKINQTSTTIDLPVGQFILKLDDITISVGIDRPVYIYKTPNISEKGNDILINYENGDKLFKVDSSSLDYSHVTKRLEELISGKVPTINVPSIYNAFYDTLSGTKGWDSVHLEVLISNVLRAKKDPQKPARLVEPFDYEQFSIKSLPALISYPLGIAFENFGQAVKAGMTADRADPSEIEKIVMGIPISEDKKRK